MHHLTSGWINQSRRVTNASFHSCHHVVINLHAAVSINDNAAVIFGGTDEPAALGCLYSIGAIGVTSNGKIQSSVTDLLEPFGVSESRIYINFFDMPRANVGWSRATFGG